MRTTYICIVLILATLLSLQTAKGENVASSTAKPSQCLELTCELTCENGFKKDSNNCPLCECTAIAAKVKPRPTVCAMPMCRTYCEQGYKKNADGCMTCDCIDEAEWESLEFDASHAHYLQIIDASDMLINLTWMAPNVAPDKLNNYMIYYFNLTSSSDKPECPSGVENPNTKWVQPTKTLEIVKGLNRGTRYGFCVQTNYSSGQVTTSHLVTYTTLGVGPSNPCECAKTKYIDYHNPCDLITNQCRCKTKYQTGEKCDQCIPGYYMHSNFGCQECHCYGDYSTGNCTITSHPGGAQILQCQCSEEHYTGPDCDMCKAGRFFNLSSNLCDLCNCNNNTRPGATNICDHWSGECTDCGYNTTGPHCESCLKGYVGGALNRTCILPLPPAVSTVSPLVLPHPVSTFHEVTVIVVVCVTVGLLLVLITVLIIYCARRGRGKPFMFWTVQMRGGREDISFSPVSRSVIESQMRGGWDDIRSSPASKSSDLCLLNDEGVQYFERDESSNGGRLEFMGGSQIFRSPRS